VIDRIVDPGGEHRQKRRYSRKDSESEDGSACPTFVHGTRAHQQGRRDNKYENRSVAGESLDVVRRRIPRRIATSSVDMRLPEGADHTYKYRENAEKSCSP
jgi:hypothetical protein